MKIYAKGKEITNSVTISIIYKTDDIPSKKKTFTITLSKEDILLHVINQDNNNNRSLIEKSELAFGPGYWWFHVPVWIVRNEKILIADIAEVENENMYNTIVDVVNIEIKLD